MNVNRPEITDAELNALTTAIRKRHGMDFANYERNSLKRGITRVMSRHNFASLLDLWLKILKEPSFLKICIDDLMVNHTELFRNPEIWRKLEQDILSGYKGKTEINCWHAGCATGEEVYTMAILWKRNGFIHKVKTLASDYSHTALQQAEKGEYPLTLIEKYQPNFQKYNPAGKLTAYFSYEKEQANVRHELKEHITFTKHKFLT